MSTIYAKRGAIVSAAPFDPARTDQGATIMMSEPDPDNPTLDGDGNPAPFVPAFVSATVETRGRVTSVHVGDMLCASDDGLFVLTPARFALIYQPLDDVVQNDAIVQTGGNQ